MQQVVYLYIQITESSTNQHLNVQNQRVKSSRNGSHKALLLSCTFVSLAFLYYVFISLGLRPQQVTSSASSPKGWFSAEKAWKLAPAVYLRTSVLLPAAPSLACPCREPATILWIECWHLVKEKHHRLTNFKIPAKFILSHVCN